MKVSFPSQFMESLGELLLPNGFSLLKSRYPYFVRITNDGIIQSISFEKKKSDFSSEYEGFMFWIGLALITLPMTDYNSEPNTLGNQTWMMPYIDFIHRCSLSLDKIEKQDTDYSYFYPKGDNAKMVNALQSVTREQIPFIIDFFNRYVTLEDLYLLKGMRFGFYQDIVILKQKIDEHLEERRIEFAKEFQKAIFVLENNPMMKQLTKRKKTELLEKHDRTNRWFIDRKKGGLAYEEYMSNAKHMKNRNLQLLAEFGVTFNPTKSAMESQSQKHLPLLGNDVHTIARNLMSGD